MDQINIFRHNPQESDINNPDQNKIRKVSHISDQKSEL